MATSSVPASAASAPACPAGADLASLRAAPARPQASAVQAAGALARPPGEPDSPQGGPESAPTRTGAVATAATPAAAATASASAGPSFGETLAASLSASAAPAQGAGGTAVRAAKGKAADSKDAKPGEAQTAVSASLAIQPLMASGLAAQGSSQGAPQGSSQVADAAGTDSSPDASGGSAASAAGAVSGVSGDHAAVTPTITVSLPARRQPVAPEDSHAAAAATDSGGGPAAANSADGGSVVPVSAPFHAALQSALSAATRLDGASQSPAASQPPGTTNDLAGANAALSQVAAPAAANRTDPSVAPQTAAPVTVQVHSEVGSGGWANELGTRLHWMANQGIGSASLRLTPEQLGPVEVKISVHQNAASVWFSAAQPDTRSALEQALPRLRELFSAQGLNLAQAGVSDQSSRSTPGERQTSTSSPRAGASRELSATSVTSAVRTHQGLIDTYA